ncbi:UDP-N-acetyl-D-glucosamine 6-dehydrogenase [Fulvia fulva]|nr:UDP-N-acetyl-D-glucosamine 6-dehydrogenase [Fulvia fulva]
MSTTRAVTSSTYSLYPTIPKNSKSFVPIRAPFTPPETPPACDVESQDDYIGNTDINYCTAFLARPVVAVVGTGYVGLHLVEAFATAYEVIAFDISQRRLDEIEPTLKAISAEGTSDATQLSRASHILISVSTIIDQNQQIDTSCIKSAIKTIDTFARPGTTIIIESSVAVGMTRDLLQPLMDTKGFLCGMSPERVDPGRSYPRYDEIPKIISGLDTASLSSIQRLYSEVFSTLVPVSAPEVAEMTKLYENCQRMMNIAFANEMADACKQLSQSLTCKINAGSKQLSPSPINIGPWEVSKAASTKPFGYMPYTPSLGVGGHCIPVNPYYLLSNSSFPLLQACTERMRDRPARIADHLMNRIGFSAGSRPEVLVVGMGFKRGQSVLSHSPGLALATHLLNSYDVYVEYVDPLVEEQDVPPVPQLRHEVDWNVEYLSRFDAIVVAVDQPGLDMGVLEQVHTQGQYVEWYVRR